MMGQEVTNGLMDSIQKSKKLYPAIELLRDPQGLAESILKRLRSGGGNQYKFQVKLLMVNFLTRLVGNHELLLLPLYPYLQRYMGGHQRDVTAILAYTVQACHCLVPPDEVYGVLKTIAHNFITERCSGEQMAVGINAVRAICSRCPSVMNTEDEGTSSSKRRSTNNALEDDNPMSTNRVAFDMEGFAQDLAGYAKHRDRSAAVAGRAWYVIRYYYLVSILFVFA
jgi:protein SDA1